MHAPLWDPCNALWEIMSECAQVFEGGWRHLCPSNPGFLPSVETQMLSYPVTLSGNTRICMRVDFCLHGNRGDSSTMRENTSLGLIKIKLQSRSLHYIHTMFNVTAFNINRSTRTKCTKGLDVWRKRVGSSEFRSFSPTQTNHRLKSLQSLSVILGILPYRLVNKTLFMLWLLCGGFENCLTVTRSLIVSEHSFLCL